MHITCADVSVPQSTGWTALFFAIQEGHLKIAEKLMSAGADVHIRDKVCTLYIHSLCTLHIDVAREGICIQDDTQ